MRNEKTYFTIKILFASNDMSKWLSYMSDTESTRIATKLTSDCDKTEDESSKN